MDGRLEEIFGDEVENTPSLEVCDAMVTAMAGNIYSELEKLIEAYGHAAVTDLMPLLVTVLESLETTCAQAKEREEQLELVKEDKQRLLIQYERERDGRKRAEERCMEMEDSIEQERKLFKANLITMEAQTKNMETKARSYADQIVGLEEQKGLLNKELASLMQVYAKVLKSYKELRYQRSLSMEAARISGRNTPLQGLEKKVLLLDFQEAPSSIESNSDNGFPEIIPTEKGLSEGLKKIKEPKSHISMDATNGKTDAENNSLTLENELKSPDITIEEAHTVIQEPEVQSVVDEIIHSTPELKLNSEPFEASTPLALLVLDQEEATRNNDSLFAEVCGTSPGFISDIDEGADLQGVGSPVEDLMVENAQLKEAQNEMDMARKSLIARVEELTAEREALKREAENVTQCLSRCEVKLRETEQDLQRTQLELEETRKQSREDAEVDIPAAQRKRFTRAEMARVLMERNQYKERLMELQDAVRRSEMLRASKDIQTVQMKKSSFWKVFDRLFSSSSAPPGKLTATDTALPLSAINRNRPISTSVPSLSHETSTVQSNSVNFPLRATSHAEEADGMPLRGKKHELYRQIRSHIWKTHGRAQLHGWSHPITGNKGDQQVGNEIKGVPVLTQLRLLDQKDPSTKLWCATGVMGAASKNERLPSLVWICSGTHSVSEIMVIDASSANHVMDQFVIQNTHILCVTSVPGYNLDVLELGQPEEVQGCEYNSRGATVWLGTQEGSVFVHSAVSNWRNCLQKIQLKDAVHSIMPANGRVIATLGDGTLAIFNRSADRNWDLENPKVVDLGRPQQSIRCSVAVNNEVWCGYRNRIYVLEPRTAKIKKWFEATPRTESQVRHLAAAGQSVWVSVRLDSILRLFHAETGQLLQELELHPFIQRMLGSVSFGLSMAQVSALEMFCGRLWVGTASGAIISIPFPSEQPGEGTESPGRDSNCLLEYAQVSFHGHRDAVKFFACVPGCMNAPMPGGGSEITENFNMLVMSGGEGYINFRIGDESGDAGEGYGELLIANPRSRRAERSHLIVWQLQT
ncbi:C-Jun-amino-terminal kinase-interacting protein 4-like [Spea bombifrons]|uniref:C-Jun-amino-terminal kinase-interacting protein 4-like n=1 Tax=Spea bombifrons TaxID=233779 RepID=UPI00234A7B41|nr:C-Jun-amino-terminal kinase-interacting protein 4-like [Spea bombifrons]